MFLEKIGVDLKHVLLELGITKGDILYVSSDIKTLLFQLMLMQNVKNKPDRNDALHEFINIFEDIVTDCGTLLFPVFSWSWCRGNGFDYHRTKGEVGTLSNWVMENRTEFVRTRHPIYSFMVWGKDAVYLKAMDNQDAWSHASPFYYLQTNHAKQLLFNIEAYQGLTFAHYLEQEVAVPYRHSKYFFGEYTDENGMIETRMYSMYVRDTEVDVACGIHNDWLIENRVAQKTNWIGNVITVVDLQKSYLLLRDDMVNNNGKNTLIFTAGSLNWNDKRNVPYEVDGIEL